MLFNCLHLPNVAAGSSITEGEYRSTKIKPKVKSNPVEGSGNPFQYDSSSSEDEPEDGSTGAALGLAPGGWSQTRKFFLQAGDGRLSGNIEELNTSTCGTFTA